MEVYVLFAHDIFSQCTLLFIQILAICKLRGVWLLRGVCNRRASFTYLFDTDSCNYMNKTI